MILGIGNDIVEIVRIEGILQRYPEKFLQRVFTSYEQEYCLKRQKPALHLAGRFAAKEAVVKALGTGFRQGITWLDIEVNQDPLGKPCVFLSPMMNERFHHPSFLLSISHCDHYATAVAVWTK